MPSLRDYVPGLGPASTLSSFIPGSTTPATLGAPLAGPESLAGDDQREVAGMTEVGKGFRSGRLGSDANYLASQEFSLRAAGRHDEADAIRNQIGLIQQRAGVFAPRVQKVEDAWANPADAPAWLGGVTGQVGASMVDSVATGVAASKAAQLVGLLPHPVAKAIGRAGSWIGAGAAAVPNVLNARGETANQMVEDPTLMANTTAEQRNDAAWLSGGAQGLVDTAMPSVIINRLGGAGIAKGVHKLPLVPRIAADMVGEGTQEVVQEGMKKGTLGYLNPERDTSGDASDYLNSFASGLGMAPHAAASIAVDNGFRRLGVKGDGERGDDIDLSGKDITTQLAAAAKGGKGRSLADSIAYSELLHGTEATPDVTDQSGLTRRRDALLSELAKYPNAAALAQPLTEMNDRLSLLRGVDAMDEAADFLAPKLGLTTEQLAKKGMGLKNSLQVDPKDFGKGQIDTSEMPARTPEQQAAVVEAEKQHKTQTSRLRALLENTYTQQHADAGSTFNPSIKKLLGSYAPELAAIMSPGVAEKPTAGEIARAKRIGSSIGSALGEKAKGALVAVAQRLGVKNSPVFDAMHDEAVKVAEHRKSGGHAVHAQHMTERDAAAQALLDAAPEFDARMAKQGVDLRLEDNAHLREQLLSHMEDHADGEGVATQAQLEEQFGKEAYAKMMEIVGGPIAPRHTAVETAEQKVTPKLSSDDVTADGSETTDFEKRGFEKNHTAVDPGSLVFGHSQTEARTAADAFKPGADGTLLKLIPADRTDFNGKRSLSVMQQRMAQSLRSQSKDYVYGRQKDGKVGTSAKELMDRQNMPAERRVALMGQYLAQENPGEDHVDFVETAKALPLLRRTDELMSAAVQSGPLTSPEASRTLRGQLKRVMNYVANPEQFLSTDIPLSAPARAAQNLAIVKAVHSAHAEMRASLSEHDSLAPLVKQFREAHDGRDPSTDELANHFFSSRFLVHAEKLADRDYLKIDNDEFTKLHREGTKLLRTAEHQAHESGGNADEHKAGMNLIHFRSLASTQKNTPADQKTVAIPAHKLVAWVRDMRNKHTGDTRTGDNTQSYSDNEKADQYLDDLKEGINALMTQKLVRGQPWIVNAAGERELFSEGMPPSLSVGDGRTHAEMKEARGKRADEKLEEEIATRQAKPLGLKSMGEAVADHNAMHERDAEIGQDEADMQDADHVRESEEMMNGSKRDRAEREHLWKMAQVVLAAADRPPAVLNKLTAFTKAKYVADRLWRDYIGDKYADPDGKLYVDPNARKPTHAQQVEAHAKAVGAILSYVTATEKTTFDPSDKDKTYRGDHFIAPLAALLTPNHMAAIAEHYPNELEKVKLLQAKVASVLLHMAYGAEKATITPGQLKQAVDSLTGYADAAHDLKMAQAQLARADGAAEKQSAQAAVTAAKSASPVQQPAYKQLLTDMALPYFEVARRRGYAARSADKARNEAVKNPGRERHFITPFAEMVFGEAPVDAPALTAEQQAAADKFDETGKGVEVKRAPPKSSVTGSVGASDSGKVTVDATPKPRAISRKPKADPNITVGELRQAQAERPAPAGDYRKTSVDLYSEVAADTAAAEQGVDNVAALAGAAAQSIRSQKTEGVVAKRENNATIADAAAKLNTGATIQQVNAGIAAKRDAAPKTVNIWHGSGENAALSNLADRPLQFNSRVYVSVEHAYQANKSGKFDQATYDKYKVAGRKIPGTMGTKTEGGWNLKLMKRLISESFKSNPDAMEKLLATGDAKLTHTQDRGVWAAEFPRILTEVRSEAAAGDTGLIAVKAPAAPTAPAAHQAKESAKLAGADLILAPAHMDGGEQSPSYAGRLGAWANRVGKIYIPAKFPDMTGKTLYVSLPGKGRGFEGYGPMIKRVMTALDAGATVRTDNEKNAGSAHNAQGEGALRAALIAGGYAEKNEGVFSSWTKAEAPKVEASTLADAIAKRQEYLNNPPADYTTEKAQAIKAWAARQLTRVQDEIEKTEKNVRFGVGEVGEYDDRLTELYDRRLDLKLLDQKTDDVLEGDASLKGFEGDAVKNSLQTADTARALTPEEIKTFDKNKLGSAAPVTKDNEIVSTRIALRRMLGDKIKTLFEESFPDMQGGADWNETKAIIRIATASSVPMMQRGYHEAMHAFYSLILKNSPDAQAMIERVTSDPKIVERMAAMLKDSPEAVEQMRNDAEERAAYAYQFWAAGMLDIGKKPETFFEKVQAFMRRVLGAVRESDKAMAIFTAFHDGKLTEPSAAGLAITKVMETGEWRAKMLKRFDKQAQAAYSEVMAAINVGMNSESPTARTIAMMFYSHPSVAKTAGKPGYIDSAQLARHQYENLIQAALRPLMGDNLERDMAELAQVLNGKAKAVQPHVEKAARDIYAALHRFHKYAREAGVDIGVRDATEDSSTYFPRVIQLETMIEKKAEFIDMLVTNYPSAMAQIGKSLAAQGKPAAPEDAAALIHQSYIDRGGIENAALSVMREDGVLNPFFASQNERKLHWIRDEHIAPFLSTDVVSTLTRYFSQGTRSAEYVRRFGEDGQKLKDMMARLGDVRFISKTGQVENYTEDGPVVKELKAAAVKAKAAKPDEWVDRRMEDLQRSFGAMEGSLGKDISAGYRQFQGNIMTYQVLRTLPLSLFSAMLDPNGLRVAGGTSENMWYAYRRGLLGVFNTWKDLVKGNPLGIKDPDKYEAAANAMGVIAPTMYLEQYGGVHSSEYSAGAARKINHKFFLANGLTSWDRDMRIAATKAAMESIVSNEANTIPAHSARWLKELGLAQNDGVVRTDADGELVTNKHVLAQMRADEKGTTKDEEMAQAEKDAHKIAVAVNRWVARAIMAPNAALRPSRASDPHYAMFFQLKSFTYAFTETTLKYAMAEAEEGNLNAGAQLMRGVPIMIAADMTKALLTNGGSLPGYMANWTMADWVLHGINRSGNLGTPQFGLDALHGAHGSIMGAVGTVGGPTVSQGIDLAAGALNGNLGTEVGKSIPFFNKIGQAAHSVGGMLDMGE